MIDGIRGHQDDVSKVFVKYAFLDIRLVLGCDCVLVPVHALAFVHSAAEVFFILRAARLTCLKVLVK